jgi:hypothetical protein
LLAAAAIAGGPAQTLEKGPTRSPHGNLQTACTSCHSAIAWKPIRNSPDFNHDTETRFPLRGLHKGVDCRRCHNSLVFGGAPVRCADCHADLHRGQFGARCEECHTVKGWSAAIQATKGHTNRFPLVGAHSALQCEDCHRGAAAATFAGLRTDCYSCHQRSFQTAPSVDHRAAGFPVTCQDCHGADSWRAARFDHARFTGFSLLGAHAQLDCTSCHVGGRYKGTPADCFSCHAKDFNAAKNPDHVQAGFPHTCTTCHLSAASWSGATFDHNKLTGFALTGAHAAVDCASCHVGGRFAGTPTDCYSCHAKDYQGAANPNHAAAHYPTDCSQCHNTNNWTSATFNHAATPFPLTGAHAALACTQCHTGGAFAISTQCQSCHLTDYNKTTNPSHVAAGFPQDCSLCHTTVNWQGAAFNHSTATKFPLTGAHATVACGLCHVNNVFAGLATDCASCHLGTFKTTTNPNHVVAGFPTDCSLCHSTSSWANAVFDHSKVGFNLTGAHAAAACAACHANNRFAGTPTQCGACHIADYNQTTNPNHAAAGFPQDCSLCHSTANWSGASFDHSKTGFALTGAHVATLCSACHVNNQFAGLSTACAGCHLNDFKSAANPNHVTAGFPQQCEVCHNTTAWQPASFDHSKTAFPLTGAHVKVTCANCHVNGVFAGTPTDCYACHKTDYAGTTNPNHAAAAFPTACTTCHTTATWAGATFNHTWFPIYTGEHAGKWTTCGDCHANANSYAVFSCITCHTHNQTDTDARHRGVRNYVYDSNNCYQCHPRGTGG